MPPGHSSIETVLHLEQPPLQKVANTAFATYRWGVAADEGQQSMLPCPLQCGVLLPNGIIEGLTTHFADYHQSWWDKGAKEKSVNCPLCAETIKWGSYHKHFGRRHVRTPGYAAYKCAVAGCAERYTTRHLLNKHLAKAHGIRPERSPRSKTTNPRKEDASLAGKRKVQLDEESEKDATTGGDEDRPDPSKRARHA